MMVIQWASWEFEGNSPFTKLSCNMTNYYQGENLYPGL